MRLLPSSAAPRHTKSFAIASKAAFSFCVALALVAAACGDSKNGSDAVVDDAGSNGTLNGDDGGVSCTKNSDCPSGSACVERRAGELASRACVVGATSNFDDAGVTDLDATSDRTVPSDSGSSGDTGSDAGRDSAGTQGTVDDAGDASSDGGPTSITSTLARFPCDTLRAAEGKPPIEAPLVGLPEIAVASEADLRAMHSNARYVFTNDITVTSAWTPIQLSTVHIDGRGHTIRGIDISSTSGSDRLGLFSALYDSIIKNLTVDGVIFRVATPSNGLVRWAAGLVGELSDVCAYDVHAKNVDASRVVVNLGGLAARVGPGFTVVVRASGEVVAMGDPQQSFVQVGGFAAQWSGGGGGCANCSGTVRLDHASPAGATGVAGFAYTFVGGNPAKPMLLEDSTGSATVHDLAGTHNYVFGLGTSVSEAIVRRIHTKVDVTGTAGVTTVAGLGIISDNSNLTLEDAFAEGSIDVGGGANTLVGLFARTPQRGNAMIARAYARVAIHATEGSTLHDCESARAVSWPFYGASNYAGGPLFEACTSPSCAGTTISTSLFWDSTVSTCTTGSDATPRTSAELGMTSTFPGWDFTNVWRLDTRGYPTLRFEP